MVIAMPATDIAQTDVTGLLARAREVAASVVDPEIPVLSIADLGVLRDVRMVDGTVEVDITPTYSGCPAMNLIALNVEMALIDAGFGMPRIKTVLSPAWTTDWMTEHGKEDARGLWHRAAGRQGLAPRAVRRRVCHLSALPFTRYPAHFRIRFDLLQGAVALQGLRRAVRLFQMHLKPL